jgi:protein TonB
MHGLVIALVLFVVPLTGVAVMPDVPEHIHYLLVSSEMPALPPPPPAATPGERVAEPADEPTPEASEREPDPPAVLDEDRSNTVPVRTVLTSVPITAGSGIRPESGLVPGRPPSFGGVPGGVLGGVPWGSARGTGAERPPPVAAAPQPPPEPVRVGGTITTPRLLHRVEPHYPLRAAMARQQGVVTIDATVDEQGQVRDVSVVESATKLLDRAAMDAVLQWRYEPLLYRGRACPFRVIVTVNFLIER